MLGFTGFSVFEIIFKLIFVMAVGIVVAKLIGYWLQWNQNQQLPRLTVFAKVVSKRTSIIYLSETDHDHISKRYFVTFEVANGGKMEFSVSGPEFRALAEEDKGSLSFQESRYLGFERE